MIFNEETAKQIAGFFGMGPDPKFQHTEDSHRRSYRFKDPETELGGTFVSDSLSGKPRNKATIVRLGATNNESTIFGMDNVTKVVMSASGISFISEDDNGTIKVALTQDGRIFGSSHELRLK